MHPILFSIGGLDLYTYGLMMALGVLTAVFFVTKDGERYGWDPDQMTRFVVFVFLFGLLGARTVYVLTRLGDPDILSVIFNPRAGFVYYGGYISSWLYILWYAKKYKLPIWSLQDAGVLGICVGLAIGRIGCFFGGCCYGSHTDLPWGVSMVNVEQLGKLHPVQLYETAILLGFFAFLWVRRTSKAYEGETLVFFTGFYAIARYILEFYRGDGIRGFVIDNVMSTSQFISVPMLIIAIYLHFKLKRAAHKK